MQTRKLSRAVPVITTVLATIAAVGLAAVIGVKTGEAASVGPTSEERPPVSCDPGWFVGSVHCTGRYCDNVRIGCRRARGAGNGSLQWTAFVSEEGNGFRRCPSNHYIAGFSCRGKYCDNVSLLCVETPTLRPLSCRQTRFFSEERGGTLDFFSGDVSGQVFLARSMQCRGRYCDNKSFEVCEMATRR